MSQQTILNALASAHISLCGAPRAAGAVVATDGTVIASWGHNADQHTVFRIASMTKSFTAALLLLLRDEGSLSLDEPIANVVPEFGSVVGPGADPAPITLRHLVTQSSGLATDDPWADRHLDATDADLDRWVAEGLCFAYPTGTAFEYSNLGFALIGRTVQRITGHTVQDLVQQRFLDSLDLSNTRWTTDAYMAGADIAEGNHPVDGELTPTAALGDGVIAPMGGLWSNAADLCRWMSFLSSAFSDKPVPGPLRASSRREMQQAHRQFPPTNITGPDGTQRRLQGSYGMGLNCLQDDRVGSVITHSGGLPGFGSNMRWLPAGFGVVMLANITYAPMGHVCASIMDALHHANVAGPKTSIRNPTLEIAAVRLAGLFASWDDAAAVQNLADNALLDVPAFIRKREVTARLEGATEIEVVEISATGDAAATMTLLALGRTHRLRFELAPIGNALIQSYSWIE